MYVDNKFVIFQIAGVEQGGDEHSSECVGSVVGCVLYKSFLAIVIPIMENFELLYIRVGCC